MSHRSFSRLKPLIGIALLLGVLGVGLMSTWYMGHGAMAQHGCIGVSAGAPSCMNLVDFASCIQAHLGVLQVISQAAPTNGSQLLVLLIVAVTLWFGFKQKRGEPDVLSRLRSRWQSLTVGSRVLSERIEQWLTLHEKRDPAPTSFVVLRVLPVPIM